ncbi:MAG: hypothetical protein A2Y73_04880 [Chloroflexi bacterium RBG_13_56_8]|nr:MAG: hypothetical protein A2Y73_04880 [Chloroflexi bacterium RBG_13_56_8]
MRREVDLYQGYTSTSVFVEDAESALTPWSVGYFNQFILPHLPVNKDAKILDIGCGYGRYVKALCDANYTNVVGIDVSEQQVSYANSELGLANVFQQDAFVMLQDKKNLYDAVLLLDILEHLEVEDSVVLIRLVRESLKDGGVAIIQVPNALAPLSPSVWGDITHQRAYTTHSITQSLLLGGFLEPNISHFELPVYTHSIKSALRRMMWTLVLKPLFSLFALSAYGNTMGGIYTVNRLAVAKK